MKFETRGITLKDDRKCPLTNEEILKIAMEQSAEDIAGARFNGRSGSISKFVIDPNGRVTANYINHRLWD